MFTLFSKIIIQKFTLLIAFTILAISILLPINAFAQSTNRVVPTKDQICGGSCPLIDSDFVPTSEGVFRFIIFFARFLTYVGVGLVVLFFVFAGLQFIVGQSENAKQNLITTFIGLIVIIVAYTIVNFIAQTLANGDFSSILGT